MSHTSGWFWRGICPVLIVILVIIVIWCWYRPCPPVTAPIPAASMVVADHGGLWMPIDNEPTKPANVAFDQWKDKRAGFLVQLGSFYELGAGGTKMPYNEANEVVFEATSGTQVRLFPGRDFQWISLVGDYAGKPVHPIDKDYADGLYPATYAGAKTTFCTVSEGCGHGAPPPPGTPGPGCTEAISKLPQPCLRMRSLHAYFEPTAIITYFQGPSGYDVRAREEPATGHFTHEFVFKDGFKVYVYQDGGERLDVQNQINALGAGLVVKVIEPAVSPHEATHDPPTGPRPL